MVSTSTAAVTAAQLAGLVESVRRAMVEGDLSLMDDADRLLLLTGLEDLARATAGASARLQVGFADSQVAEQQARGIPRRRRGLAVADDLAAARKTSPYWGSRDLACSRALVSEMPETLGALEAGIISGHQARVITEATTCLDPDDRAEVDSRLAGALAGMSTREIGAAARALAYEVDPAGFVARARKAAKDRGVWCRPSPDVMGILSAKLPAQMAVAAYQALREHAVTAKSSGDPRTLNQLMADELWSRITGRTVVEGIDVEVGLVMTDAALFDGASDTADLKGYGPIPAELARDLLRPTTAAQGASDDPVDDTTSPEAGDSTDDREDELGADSTGPGQGQGQRAGTGPGPVPPACPQGIYCTDAGCQLLHGVQPVAGPARAAGAHRSAAGSSGTPDLSGSGAPDLSDPVIRATKAWVRRLYLDPVTGSLSARDPRKRLFTGAARAFLIARDRTCRNPWCGAPIRDADHIVPDRDGGPTAVDNGQGLCKRCNLAREHARHAPPSVGDYRRPPVLLDTHLGKIPAGTHQPRPTVTTPTARSNTTAGSGDSTDDHAA